MPIDATITPITRTEQYLDGIANETTEGIPPFPITREEMYLDAIANGNADNIPVPITRTEMYLNAIAQNSGGGGGDAWTLIGSKEFEVSTTSTSATVIGNIDVDINNVSTNDILYVRVRDKAGKRNGYFYGSDSIIAMVKMKNEETGGDQTIGTFILGVNSSGKYDGADTNRCIYPSSFNNESKSVIMSSRYYSSFGTIDGTYKVDVYKLTPPFTMFE